MKECPDCGWGRLCTCGEIDRPVQKRCSDEQIREWMKRHNIDLHTTDARCAFEDAATLKPE